jgi:hypothetical protein
MAWYSVSRRVDARTVALWFVVGVAALLAVGASAAGLSGRVLDVFGAPMAGVPLSARAAPKRPTGEPLPSTDTPHETASGRDGAYTIEGLTDATYELGIARARLGAGPGYEIVGARIRGVPVAVDGHPLLLGLDGVVTDVDVVAVRTAVFPTTQRVELRVTRADGSPAARAKVSYDVVEANGGWSMGTRANELGECGFSREKPAVGTLTVSLEGHSAFLRVRFEETGPSRDPLHVTLSAASDWPPDGSEWRRNPDNDHEYRVIIAASWAAAGERARAQGAHLGTITSDEERRWVASLLGNASAYIGLSDADEEGTWRWVTGEPFAYSHWGDGEPNNSGGVEHYVVMQGGSGEWNDVQERSMLTRGAAVIERDASAGGSPKPAEPVMVDARELMPLAMGSVWNYEDQVSGDSKTVRVTEASEDADGSVSYTVDMSVFRVVATMSYRDGGGLSVMFPEELPDLVVPWLPDGGEAAWDVRAEDGGGGLMRFRVVDTAGVVITPSGTYEDCTAVRLDIAGDESGYFHYAPGVGLVRMTSSAGQSEGGQLRTDWVLTSYTPGE